MNWELQLEVLGEVALSMALGALLGLEREAAHKPAGLQTHMLVAGSAALLVGPGGRPRNALLRAGDALAASRMLGRNLRRGPYCPLDPWPLVRRSRATPPRGQRVWETARSPAQGMPALRLSLRPPRARNGHFSDRLPAHAIIRTMVRPGPLATLRGVKLLEDRFFPGGRQSSPGGRSFPDDL